MSSFLCLGQDNYRVPLQLFQENRSKLAKKLLKTSDNNTKFYIVLQGGKSPQRYDTDHEPIFRQESYFWYLTGVKEPDCSIVLEISGNDADPTIRTTLLIPKLPESYATIMGHIKTCEEWKNEYGVDQVLFTERLQSYLEEQTTSTGQRILLLQGLNTDSDTMYQELIPTFLEESQVMKPFLDYDTLFPILAECRVIKSPLELALLEHVSQVSSFAHTYVMRNTRPGMYEYQCESLFKHYTYYNYGSRLQSYTSICGCGPNAAVLHYGHTGEPNSRKIASDDNCLFDMGAEYQCYASDITCSFPASGKFSPKYQPIYEAVLNAQRAVIAMIEPGVSWVDCHERAELEILKGLYKIGIVVLPKGKNGTTDEEEKKNNNNGDKDHELDETIIETLKELVHNHRLGAVFMPHGLGHFLGIDTHDVGGYLPGHPPRSPLPGLRSLRTSRILQQNMVLTVEPGCYFIDHLLNGALQPSNILSQYLNEELLKEYRGFGGVRLEDVVTVTSKENGGCINFTLCPRTVSEVEHVMAGGKWPPLVDEAAELKRIKLTDPISPLPPPPSL